MMVSHLDPELALVDRRTALRLHRHQLHRPPDAQRTGPFLKREYHWTNTDFATVLIAFRIAYTIGQGLNGRILDKLGTGRGLSLAVLFYSIVASCTALAQGIMGWRFFRFLLGYGEGANWPGATKAVSEWFPDRERGWAVALFDSGSSVGGAVAAFLILPLYHFFGSWRPAVLIVGCLGFLWLIAWRKLYRPVDKHPRLSPEERELIRSGQAGRTTGTEGAAPPMRWRRLLAYKQTWGIVLGRTLFDPYWFFVSEWFPLLLMSRKISVESSIMAFWIPFLAADLGNFFGGGLSSWWIKRGWPVGKARRTVLGVLGPSMLLLVPAAFTSSYLLLVSCFAWSTFAYAACSTVFLSFPADVFHTRAVASVSGLSGTGAGIGTLITEWLIGYVSDRYSFEPIIIAASMVPCVATVIFVTLVRAAKRPDPAGILQQF